MATVLYFLVPFLPVIINVVPGVQFTGATTVTGLLLLALMVGFVEESVFRGLMLTALRERGEWWAVIVTSVLFGVTHLANLLAGATVLETVSQVAYTVAFGVAFAALAIRKEVIWPLVLAHAAIDAAYFLQPSGFVFSPTSTLIINFGLVIVFIGFGVVVMRRPASDLASAVGDRRGSESGCADEKTDPVRDAHGQRAADHEAENRGRA